MIYVVNALCCRTTASCCWDGLTRLTCDDFHVMTSSTSWYYVMIWRRSSEATTPYSKTAVIHRISHLVRDHVIVLLSLQCVSSIGQIIKSVCMSVSEWVSQSVERSTDRNLPPIFTKLATKVESQEMWLPIVWWKSEILHPPNRKWN